MKPPPPLEIVDSDEHYVVEQILDSQLIWGWLHFLIKWEGYGYEENTWISESNISAPDKIQEFYRNHPRAPQQVLSSAFQSIHFQNASASSAQHSKRVVMSGDNCLDHQPLLDHQSILGSSLGSSPWSSHWSSPFDFQFNLQCNLQSTLQSSPWLPPWLPLWLSHWSSLFNHR